MLAYSRRLWALALGCSNRVSTSGDFILVVDDVGVVETPFLGSPRYRAGLVYRGQPFSFVCASRGGSDTGRAAPFP